MRRIHSTIIILFFGLFLMQINIPVFAQQNTGEVKGIVKDAQRGEPLIGANVLLQGTVLGANTDYDGKYSIKKVPEGEYTILVRFVSYKTESRRISVRAGETATADFTLSSSAVQMDEVVVTGQGAAIEKRKLPTTVESISLREIERAPAQSLDGLLQGRVTGLMSFSPSGLPGSGARIQARGIKSALGATTPVVYVDGVRVDVSDNYRLVDNTGGAVSSSLADLVIGDIEKIEVIKGGAASTLYGSEAANGVIQIFTKRGLSGGVVPGAPKWRFSVTSGFDAPELKFTKEQETKDLFYRKTGLYQQYKMNVVGGTEMLSYNMSGSMAENKGVVTRDKLSEKMYNLFTGLRAVLGERSDLQVSANYVHHDFGIVYNNNIIWAPLGLLEQEMVFKPEYTDNPDSLLNLYLLPKIREKVNRFTISTNITYTPTAEFSNKFVFGIDYRKNEQRLFAPIEAQDVVMQEGGFIHRNDRDYMTLTMSYTGSYKLPKLGPVDQTLAFGAQGFRVEDREVSANGDNFPIPGTEDVDNASLVTAFESNRQLFNGGVFFADQISILDNIFIDLGIRFDGNSTFGEDIGIQTYPKCGIAYNISDESYYPEGLKPYVGHLKLRASWGMTGNFPPPFTKDRTYTAATFLDQSGLNFGNPGDRNLKPERTSSIDAGFDAGFLEDRLSIEFNYYTQITKDALFSVATDPAGGFGFQQRNVGEIENSGMEISLRANVIKTNDVDLELRFGIATLQNKVLSLGGAAGFSVGGFSFSPQRIEEGQPVGVWQVNVPIVEADGTYQGNYLANQRMGNPTPKYYGSFGFELGLFRNLQISFMAEYAMGHDLQNVLTILRYFSGYEDAINAIPVSQNPSKQYTFSTASSVWIEKSDWIKVREITIRYQLPDLLFKGVNLTLSGRNLFVFGTSAGVDPEQSWFRGARALEVGGIGGCTISAPKQIRFGVEVVL